MSEEIGLPSGTVSLESEPATVVGPPVAPAAPAAPEPAPAAPEPPAEPDEEAVEGLTEDATGRRYVPLKALQATRAELKAAKALAAEAETYKEQAAHGKQLDQWVASVQPLLKALKDRPDLVNAAMSGQPVAHQAAPQAQQDAQDEALLPTQDLSLIHI